MDELTQVGIVVHLLRSVWVAIGTVECVAGHWLTGLDGTMVCMDSMMIQGILTLMVSM